jgi:hypothetical protein
MRRCRRAHFPGITGQSSRSALLALPALLALLPLTLPTGCYKPPPCHNVLDTQAVSPSGKFKAVAFRRICSQDQAITTNVSIVPVDRPLPEGKGNIFAYEKPVRIRVAWLTDRKLAVYTYIDPAKATHLDKSGDVEIQYSKLEDVELEP